MICCAALNSQCNDFAGTFFGFITGLLFYFHHFNGFFMNQFVFKVLQQIVFSLFHCEAGNTFQHFKLALFYGFCFLQALLRLFVLLLDLLFLALGVLLFGFASGSGIAVAKPDDLFPTIACGADPSGRPFMPPAVGLLFVIGLVSAAFSSSGSSLTSITTTFTLDILKAGERRDEAVLVKTRGRVHAGAAVVMGAVICGFRAIGDESVINAVYTISGYTYGPLLGLFLFGIFTRRRPREAWVPLICIASPLLCMLLKAHSEQWFGGWRIGFELLLINCALTMLGLWLASVGCRKIRIS